MKLKSLIVTTLLCFATSALAQWFPGRAQVSILPGQVTVQVFNPNYEPIICNGQVFGQTSYGQIFSSFFGEQFLPAGAFRFAQVYATPYAPFVGGWANVHCRFARYW